MKKLFILSFTSLMCIYCANVEAQTSKAAYLSIERVIMQTRKLDSVKLEIEVFRAKLDSQMQARYEKLVSKMQSCWTMPEELYGQRLLEMEAEIKRFERDVKTFQEELTVWLKFLAAVRLASYVL